MISICIPTYNGEKFIKKQIGSILCQISSEDEIIISDDSSTDTTIEIIKSFNDPRIKIIDGNTFHSPIFNLENALKSASGDYIFLADQDDIWKDNKIAITLLYLKDYSTVVSDCNLINENDFEIHSSFFQLNKSKPGLIHNFINNSYLGCCMAFNRNILQAVLPFPKEIAMHDIWIGLISEIAGKPIFIQDKLISYRRHSNNFSPTSKASTFSLSFKMKYRALIAYYGLSRYISLKLK